MSAVRHRIGNLLSSNNVLDETGKELFKKDLSSQNANPQNNPFMLAADSGLAPPPSNYAVRSRPSDDHVTGRADQSSETTVRSRNKIEGLPKHEQKSATQKISKKKAVDDATGVIIDPPKVSSHSRKKS